MVIEGERRIHESSNLAVKERTCLFEHFCSSAIREGLTTGRDRSTHRLNTLNRPSFPIIEIEVKEQHMSFLRTVTRALPTSLFAYPSHQFACPLGILE